MFRKQIYLQAMMSWTSLLPSSPWTLRRNRTSSQASALKMQWRWMSVDALSTGESSTVSQRVEAYMGSQERVYSCDSINSFWKMQWRWMSVDAPSTGESSTISQRVEAYIGSQEREFPWKMRWLWMSVDALSTGKSSIISQRVEAYIGSQEIHVK